MKINCNIHYCEKSNRCHWYLTPIKKADRFLKTELDRQICEEHKFFTEVDLRIICQ